MKRIFKQVPRILFGEGSLSQIKELIPEKLQNDILFIVDDSLPELPILKIVDEGKLKRKDYAKKMRKKKNGHNVKEKLRRRKK